MVDRVFKFNKKRSKPVEADTDEKVCKHCGRRDPSETEILESYGFKFKPVQDLFGQGIEPLRVLSQPGIVLPTITTTSWDYTIYNSGTVTVPAQGTSYSNWK